MKKVRFSENIDIQYYKLTEKEIKYKQISLDLYLKIEHMKQKIKEYKQKIEQREMEQQKLKKITEEITSDYLTYVIYIIDKVIDFICRII